MSDSETRHCFIPAVRRGLATLIGERAAGPRAQLTVELTAEASLKGSVANPDPATPTQNLELYGPGDVLGFDERIVVRTDPKNGVGDFEPDYFPAITFADSEFVWRFTAEGAERDGKLSPWITLIVLVAAPKGDSFKAEFEESERTDPSLPRCIEVNPETLPDLEQAYRWAHVHVVTEKGSDDRDKLLDLLRREPERAVCRLLCARRLAPGVRYAAFVVPVFALGATVGLGLPPDAGTNALTLAWEQTRQGGSVTCVSPLPKGTKNENWIKLPYYYRWEFGTGMMGDFEQLVRRLEPRKLTKIGLRPIDCARPGFDIPGVDRPDVKKEEKSVLEMEGALRSLDTEYTRWGQDLSDATEAPPPEPSELQVKLAELLNKPNTEDLSPSSRRQLDFNVEHPSAAFNGQEPTATPSLVGSELVIKWSTTAPRTTRIEYSRTGTTPLLSIESSELTMPHTVTLRKLIPEREYSFTISGAESGGEKVELKGTFTILLPVVAPPAYGRWHYGKLRELDNKSVVVKAEYRNMWLDTLNLDPRHRAAAGLGTEVIRKQQEPLMAAAWEQLGDIEKANDLLRRAQLGREGALRIHERLQHLREDEFVRVTGAAQRVTFFNVAIGETERLTIGTYLQNKTPLPSAAFDPGFRRMASPRRAISKRQNRLLRSNLRNGVVPAARLRGNLIQRLAEGDLEAAGPLPAPTGTPRLEEVTKRLVETVNASMPRPRGAETSAQPIPAGQGLLFSDQLIKSADVAHDLKHRKPFAKLSGWQQIAPRASVAQDALNNWLDVDQGEPCPPAQTGDFVSGLRAQLLNQLQPNATSVEWVRNRFRLSGILSQRFETDHTGDPLDPIMWAPEFDQPMYEALRDMSQSLLLPSVEKIPQNTVGCLLSNRRFIESYFCGLNHSFAAELLWRCFPTDHRGSYFRQFWDVSGNVPDESAANTLLGASLRETVLSGITELSRKEKTSILARRADLALEAFMDAELSEETMKRLGRDFVGALSDLTDAEISDAARFVISREGLAEALKDIKPLTEWGEGALGSNRQADGTREGFVLVIRGDLLRRYPNALIYAVEEGYDAQGRLRPRLPEYVGEPASSARVFPIFGATLPPDLSFFGFPFEKDEAAHKYFVIEEQPGEPRFGADASCADPERVQADFANLSWSHLGYGIGDEDRRYGTYLDSPQELDLLDFKMEEREEEWRSASSAKRAWCTWQKPVRIAIHASRLMP